MYLQLSFTHVLEPHRHLRTHARRHHHIHTYVCYRLKQEMLKKGEVFYFLFLKKTKNKTICIQFVLSAVQSLSSEKFNTRSYLLVTPVISHQVSHPHICITSHPHSSIVGPPASVNNTHNHIMHTHLILYL